MFCMWKLSFTHKIKHQNRTVEIFQYIPNRTNIPICTKKRYRNKSSGRKKFRLLIDYRKLNEKTIYDRYPIPKITDILDKLREAKYFSIIDCPASTNWSILFRLCGRHHHILQLASRSWEKFSTSSPKTERQMWDFPERNSILRANSIWRWSSAQ